MHRSPDTIYPFHSNLESYYMAIILFQALQSILVEALLTDTCNALRAPCILLNLPLRLAAVGCTLQ